MAWNGSDSAGEKAKGEKVKGKRPSATRASTSARKFNYRALAAGLIVVVLGVGVVWIMRPQMPDDGPVPAERPAKTAETAANVPPKAVDEPTETPAADAPSQPEKPVAVQKKPLPPPPGSQRVMTLMDGTVVTNKLRTIFKRPFENVLASALRPNGTGRTLLLAMRRRYSDAELMQMLREMTVPEDGDSEAARKCKQEVQQLKEAILLEVANGKSLDEVFDGIASQHMSDQMLRVRTRQMQAEAIRSGDAESVREATAVANKLREEQGLEKLELPKRFEKPPKAEEAGASAEPQEDGAGEEAEQ